MGQARILNFTNAMDAIYMALMNWGDTLLGLKLSDGGHLTHGHPVTFSGRAYRAISYGVDPQSGKIDLRSGDRNFGEINE